MYIKFVFIFIAVVFFYFNCNYETNSNISDIQNISTENWIIIKQYDLTFSVPGNMKKHNIQGRDNLVSKYSNDEISVSFESGVGSEILQKLEKDDDIEKYEKKEIVNQGIKGVQIDYHFVEGKTNFDDRDKRFAKMVSFDCERESNSITFLILYAYPENSLIAEKIIKSITLSCS